MKASVDLTKRINSLVSLLPKFREAVKQNGVIELDGLQKTVDRLCQDILALPKEESEPLKPRLIVLADEVGRLEELIIKQKSDIKSQIQKNDKSQQAAEAYQSRQTPSSGNS